MQEEKDELRQVIPLSKLRPGERGTIERINGARELRRRYIEMGLVRGEIILVEKRAPLGDPIQYRVKGYNISLRTKDAEKILVLSENGKLDG